MTGRRFEILDGMRGSAALYVVLMHLFESNFPDLADNPFHHAYLGVDFFFMLSGFVIGHAYDHRWGSWTIKDFFRARLIRLHPLVILSIVFGAVGYWFDPFTGNSQDVSMMRLMIGVAVGMLLIPSPALPNRWGETHSLNGPHWTLFQEYLANIIYGLIGRRLSRNGLIAVLVITAIALLITAIQIGQLFLGWGADNFWVAPIRMAFPFFAGLFLFRIKARIRMPMAYPLLTLLLLIVFILPVFPGRALNGIYDFLVILLIFPLIIVAGAGSTISGPIASLCNFFGRISYPLYITHYPFIYIYAHWVAEKKPSSQASLLVGAGLLVWFFLLAYIAVRFYDEPIRAWLNKKYNKQVRPDLNTK